MEVIRNDWFSTPVWYIKTDFDSDFNNEILKDIENTKEKVDNIWQIESVALYHLGRFALKTIQELTFDYYPNTDFRYYHARGWLNSHPPGKSLGVHTHGSKIAMTYYLKAPKDGGDLLVIDPRGGVSWGNEIDPKNPHLDGMKFKRIEPKEGHLVFFPGFLMHMVEENKSNEYRYSLTSNLGTTQGNFNAG